MKNNSFFILKAIMLLMLSFFCVTTYAKPEKIKYGKNIIYFGETYEFQGEKVPYGHGVLTLFDKDKEIPTIVIVGDFQSIDQDSKGMYMIKKASMSSTRIGIWSFRGFICYSIVADKNSSNVLLAFFGEISQTPISVSGKRTMEIGVTELYLGFSYDKDQKFWNVQLENPNCTIAQQPIPTALSELSYKDEDIQRVVCEVSYSRDRISFDNITFQLKDGGTFINNKLSFSDNSFYVINGKKWHGSKILQNGVLSKNENNENCKIRYNNGSTYEGTIKTTLIDLINSSLKIQYTA